MTAEEVLNQLDEELDRLEKRKRELTEAREKLARERAELQPVKDYVTAREAFFKGEQESLDGEAGEIAFAFKDLRREVAEARRATDRDLKEVQRVALAQRKETLGELKNVEDAINDLESGDNGDE
jgi:DNA repair exonuclease SbcCD ATPase subunit